MVMANSITMGFDLQAVKEIRDSESVNDSIVQFCKHVIIFSFKLINDASAAYQCSFLSGAIEGVLFLLLKKYLVSVC